MTIRSLYDKVKENHFLKLDWNEKYNSIVILGFWENNYGFVRGNVQSCLTTAHGLVRSVFVEL